MSPKAKKILLACATILGLALTVFSPEAKSAICGDAPAASK